MERRVDMKKALAPPILGATVLLLILAACGPVRVPGGGQHATPLPTDEPKVITFEVEPAVQPSLSPSVGNGQEVYHRTIDGQSCASCHGEQGQPTASGAPDFTRADWIRDKQPLELEAFLREDSQHHYVDSLSLQERWDVLAYVRYLGIDMEVLRATSTGLFGQNCNVCHGNAGFGNGFLAPTMTPLPRNLTDFQHWGVQRTDREIYDNIWYGVHWSAMPPWRETLESDEVWQIVDFIRSLQSQPPTD